MPPRNGDVPTKCGLHTVGVHFGIAAIEEERLFCCSCRLIKSTVFGINGLHAILLVKGPIVRLDIYRFETSYDLLITSHTLAPEESEPKPKLETKLIFFHRFGILERELWGKDKMFRGAVAPQFFMSMEAKQE